MDKQVNDARSNLLISYINHEEQNEYHYDIVCTDLCLYDNWYNLSLYEQQIDRQVERIRDWSEHVYWANHSIYDKYLEANQDERKKDIYKYVIQLEQIRLKLINGIQTISTAIISVIEEYLGKDSKRIQVIDWKKRQTQIVSACIRKLKNYTDNSYINTVNSSIADNELDENASELTKNEKTGDKRKKPTGVIHSYGKHDKQRLRDYFHFEGADEIRIACLFLLIVGHFKSDEQKIPPITKYFIDLSYYDKWLITNVRVPEKISEISKSLQPATLELTKFYIELLSTRKTIAYNVQFEYKDMTVFPSSDYEHLSNKCKHFRQIADDINNSDHSDIVCLFYLLTNYPIIYMPKNQIYYKKFFDFDEQVVDWKLLSNIKK